MNLLAHAFVALGSEATADTEVDADFVLGALLPDLASMAGVRFDRSVLAPAVDRGVTCHVRADATFHVLPAFVSGAGAIRREVREGGLGAGAARAVGHVGWELLLDGTLVGTATEEAFVAALDRAGRENVRDAVSSPERWADLLSYRAAMRRLRYDDPAWVAERLHRILAGRPLLAFDATHVPVVARVLEDHAAAVADAAGEVLTTTTDAVRTPEGSRDSTA